MISNKFINKGFKINLYNQNPFDFVDLLKNNFLKYGIILIDNFQLPPDKLDEFTSKFTLEYSNDAARRKVFFKKKNIRSVDVGDHEIPLHSESSFTPTRPKIMWFYSLPDNLSNSPTTICDGTKIWETLPKSLKEKFLSLPIVYENSVDIFKSKSKNRKWFIDKVGCSNSFIDYEQGKFNYNFTTFACNYDPILNKISFCNHLLSINDESQIKIARFINGELIESNLLNKINNYCKPYIYEHKWKQNQLIILDNYRFMHGRRKISNKKKRALINVQSFRINF